MTPDGAPLEHHRLGSMLTLAASDLGAARSQMAFTLGFHIILASLGVALPAMMLIANYRGSPGAGRRWSR
jgi:cytochrome bd-type quinol oxidase subunit 1